MFSFLTKPLYAGNPPYTLKPSVVAKATGCAKYAIAVIIAFFLSSCLACGVAGLILDFKNPAAVFGLGFGCFLILFVVSVRMAKTKFTGHFNGQVIFHTNRLIIQENGSVPIQHPYQKITSVQIDKSKGEQLVYRFDIQGRSSYTLDRSLARFPDDNELLVRSALPVVANNWDRMIFSEGRTFVIQPEYGRFSLKVGGMFWILIGCAQIFYPATWSNLSGYFRRGWKMLSLSRFTGKPFEVCSEGIRHVNEPGRYTPFSELRVTKYDDIGLIIQGGMDGSEFRAPIMATNAYTFGYWIQDRTSRGMLSDPGGGLGYDPADEVIEVTAIDEIGAVEENKSPPRKFGEGYSDLKGDIF